MNGGLILGCVIGSILMAIFVVLSFCNNVERRKIMKNLVPGTKFVFYGYGGGGDPFNVQNITYTIIEVKAGHVLYKYEIKAPKLQPSLMESDGERSTSIKSFTTSMLRTKNLIILTK